MRKVVVTHRVHEDVAALLRQHAEADVNTTSGTWPVAELLRRIADADAVIVFMPDRVDEAFLAAAPRLRLVAGALKGWDNLDVAACRRRGVRVTVVEDLLTAPTADLAVALLLALTRHVIAGDRRVREPGYAGWRPVLYGAGLAGRTAGIVGFGRLGRAIAKRLDGFGARVIATDPAADAAGDPRAVPFDVLLAESDHIVVSAPLVPSTLGLVGRTALGKMRPGASLVNVGRGSVVDEDAVAAALASGHLGGYAADVFAFEDLSLTDRPRAIPQALLAFPDRTVFTPHLGSAVAEVRLAIEMQAAESVIDLLEGRTPRGLVELR